MASIKLGTLLLKANVLTEQQITNALNEQQKWGGRLGEILVRMNILTEEMLVKALSKQLNVISVNLDSIPGVPPQVRAKVPSPVARDLNALPLQLRDDGKTLVVAMSEPQNLGHIDTLRS
ncbi:MAG: ral secretion pathway protein N-terminal domain protein, partial [Myxococcaceae bacterium]|nr:ral secretion pathway protein N-terminal domain protein [Myxococcaceae bacterium]